MLGLKQFLFKGDALELPEQIPPALAAWRGITAPSLDEGHFHNRYIVLDIVTSGVKPASDRVLGMAACTVHRELVSPGDAFYAYSADEEGDQGVHDDGLNEHQLMAFLQFSAKCPIVTYHGAFVGEFLQRTYKEKLGLNFQPTWIDFAWLLPTLFPEKWHTIRPLDHWIDAFGLDAGSGRRSSMENSLLLARMFQMLLIRAKEKHIDTAQALIQESEASCQLLRTH